MAAAKNAALGQDDVCRGGHGVVHHPCECLPTIYLHVFPVVYLCVLCINHCAACVVHHPCGAVRARLFNSLIHHIFAQAAVPALARACNSVSPHIKAKADVWNLPCVDTLSS